ncbi:MAG: HAMP domain-containing sensor histidine kinase, partial [Chloroflexota bacterium]
ISFTAAGFVRVSTGVEGNPGQVFVEVADSGAGIDSEDMPHLFERFYRGRQAGQSHVPGAGLGLAIVKEIVNLHQGKIAVQSRPGEGSTFRVWLPLAEKT